MSLKLKEGKEFKGLSGQNATYGTVLFVAINRFDLTGNIEIGLFADEDCFNNKFSPVLGGNISIPLTGEDYIGLTEEQQNIVNNFIGLAEDIALAKTQGVNEEKYIEDWEKA